MENEKINIKKSSFNPWLIVVGLALIWVMLLMAYIFIPGKKNLQNNITSNTSSMETSDEVTQIEMDLKNNEIDYLRSVRYAKFMKS